MIFDSFACTPFDVRGELILLHVLSRAGSGRVPKELEEVARIEHLEISEADMLRSVAEGILHAAEERVRERGVKNVRTTTDVGDAARAIVAYAKDHNIDLIVMGRRDLCSGPLPLRGMNQLASRFLQYQKLRCFLRAK